MSWKRLCIIQGNIIFFTLAILAGILRNNPDMKQIACTLPLLGYWDLHPLLLKFGWAMHDCAGQSAHERLLRDFPQKREHFLHPTEITAGEWSWETFNKVSKNMTQPIIVRGLLENSSCRNWDPDALVEAIGSAKIAYPHLKKSRNLHGFQMPRIEIEKKPLQEFLTELKNQEPSYLSFDWQLLQRFLKGDQTLDLNEYFPDEFQEKALQNLFLSNFSSNILASSFHAASNFNWFLQCRGAKRWWMVAPEYISYLGVWAQGMIYLPSNHNEKEIIEHLPMHMVDTDEGDMLFIPAFWMHAVATRAGFSFALANRMDYFWNAFFAHPWFYGLSMIQSPVFFVRVITNHFFSDVSYTLGSLGFVCDTLKGYTSSQEVTLENHAYRDHDWTIS